jgi:cbb3-type cytochrome oxidase subunit 3
MGVVTGLLLLCFVVGVALLYAPRRRHELEQAARLPLDAEGEDAR